MRSRSAFVGEILPREFRLHEGLKFRRCLTGSRKEFEDADHLRGRHEANAFHKTSGRTDKGAAFFCGPSDLAGDRKNALADIR